MKARQIIRYLLIGWLLAVTAEYLLLPVEARDLSGFGGLCRMSLPRVAGITLGAAFLAFLVERLGVSQKIQRFLLPGCFGVLAIAAVLASFSWAFLGACALVFVLLTVYGFLGWDSRPIPVGKGERAGKGSLWAAAVLAATFFLFVSAWTVGRYCSFSSPTYDFGIFSQMFYYMKETGLPMTTLERDGLLSHFAVHVSPTYYLMLPFYCLAPSPATLQILQAAVLTSSVIPLWKLGRLHGLPGWQRAALTAVLLLYPAFSGGTGYDLHENCFLTPLLLWLFYGIDRDDPALTAIAAALCLGVKEDAAVYVAVIGLWVLLDALLDGARKKRLAAGGLLLLSSLGWFLLVTGYLANYGDGVMTYRYRNFLYDGSSSLLTVVKAVLLHPMKALYECVDPDKLSFLALTLLPLMGLPLWTRQYQRFLLLIPYLLVNLMPDYQYQHNIFFQYTFGSTACLMYLCVVNLADQKASRAPVLAGAVAVSILCFGAAICPRAVRYPVQCVRYAESYQDTREALSQIPEDAAVSATTFYTAHLSRREILYDICYASREHILETEYVVLSIPGDGEYQAYADSDGQSGRENFIAFLTENGYTPCWELEDRLVIYRKSVFPVGATTP